MPHANINNCAVVVPNWNGEEHLADCLKSLMAQSVKAHIVVVDNGSVDGSVALIQKDFPSAELIKLPKNTGFTGGVNAGIRQALAKNYPFIALLNNDAAADPDWLRMLVHHLQKHPEAGIATSKIVSWDGHHFDSAGQCYTTWGLPFARGRGETAGEQYDTQPDVFATSGGACLLRSSMLNQIGLFDQHFFAYYEDVDISFRAQLAGWKIHYVPSSIAKHHIGATGDSIKGFTTYQTLKNLPLLLVKNLPARYFPLVLPRFMLAYGLFLLSASARGQGGSALKGVCLALWFLPSACAARWHQRRLCTVKPAYIWQLLTHSIPPGATRLQAFVEHFTNLKRTKVIS